MNQPRKLDLRKDFATIHGSSDGSKYLQNNIKFGANLYEILPSPEALQKENEAYTAEHIRKAQESLRKQDKESKIKIASNQMPMPKAKGRPPRTDAQLDLTSKE